jgi:hypothetical protein
MIGPERLEGTALYPRQHSTKMPTYLCDSDVEVNEPVSNILGLALSFVKTRQF